MTTSYNIIYNYSKVTAEHWSRYITGHNVLFICIGYQNLTQEMVKLESQDCIMLNYHVLHNMYASLFHYCTLVIHVYLFH